MDGTRIRRLKFVHIQVIRANVELCISKKKSPNEAWKMRISDEVSAATEAGPLAGISMMVSLNVIISY